MSATTKTPSNMSQENVLRGVHNEQLQVLGVSGFISGKVGHKITQTISTTSATDDTLVFTYFDGTTQLMAITVVYTDGTRGTLLSVERTA